MAHETHGTRFRPAPPELQSRARALIQEVGIREAARRLGLGRTATATIAAGGNTDDGTLARVALHQQEPRP